MHTPLPHHPTCCRRNSFVTDRTILQPFKSTMYKAVSIVLLALPALASASLRGLQAATTPAVERVCNVVR